MKIEHPKFGLCEACKQWADDVSELNIVIQRRIAEFGKKNGFEQLHYELLRLQRIRSGVWQSLPAFLAAEEAKGEQVA